MITPSYHLCTTAALLLSTALLAQTKDFSAWSHRAAIEVNATGLTRVELTPELLDVCAPAKDASATAPHDLRLVSPSGTETPFVIETPSTRRTGWKAVQEFTHKPSTREAGIVEFRVPETHPVDGIELTGFHEDFIKTITIEGSPDGVDWRRLTDDVVLFRQQGVMRLRAGFPPVTVARIRVTLDHRSSSSVFVGGANYHEAVNESPWTEQPVTVLTRHEENSQSRLRLDVGGANAFLRGLRLDIADPLFERQVEVRVAQADDKPGLVIGGGTVYRVPIAGRQEEALEVPVNLRPGRREVELVVSNRDSPPLDIRSLNVQRHRLTLLFHAGSAGAWTLHAGNRNASTPSYDIASLTRGLDTTQTQEATLAPVTPNAEFRSTAALPDTGEEGAAIDLSQWSWRKPVQFNSAGVIEVELDAEALAGAAVDYRDLRIVREGRQIPFLLHFPATKREIAAEFSSVESKKKPSYSLWHITLPTDRFPVSELSLEVGTPVFERNFGVLDLTKLRDQRGSEYQHTIGSGRWKRLPSDAAGPVRVTLHQRPAGKMLELSTDNGDNPALQLQSVRLVHPVVQVIFRAPDPAPVMLCYGNRDARFPGYDLQLVRKEFDAAVKTVATLGTAEKLEGFQPERDDVSGVGSIWLWAALALVVGGLLWIVARLLPAEPGT